jgi:ABC-type lipoprotein release transport system permease subunit
VQGVKAVSERLLVNAMVASAENGAGVKVTGIDPEREKLVTNIFSKVAGGAYLEGKSTPILIGQQLAEKLSVKLRSRIVITMQTMDGTLTSGLFRVDGIYKTSNTMFDEANVFVRSDDLAALMESDSEICHEIAVFLDDGYDLAVAAGAISSAFPQTDVKTWRELMPEVTYMEETMDVFMYFFMLIILAALVFGIINTMLMAVLERPHELGMLMAVGMNRKRVFGMILLETVMLSLTGGIIGIAGAYSLVLFTYRKGIDLSFLADGIESMGYVKHGLSFARY